MVLLQALQTAEKQRDISTPLPSKSLSLGALTKQETWGWEGGGQEDMR